MREENLKPNEHVDMVLDDLIRANPDKFKDALFKQPSLKGWFTGEASRMVGRRISPFVIGQAMERKLEDARAKEQ